MSYLNVPIQAHHFTVTAPGPMESLQIDYCGPFPADEEGNTQVLTVIDTFTRAVGLYAVKDLEAGEAHSTMLTSPHRHLWLPQSHRDRLWSPIHY